MPVILTMIIVLMILKVADEDGVSNYMTCDK